MAKEKAMSKPVEARIPSIQKLGFKLTPPLFFSLTLIAIASFVESSRGMKAPGKKKVAPTTEGLSKGLTFVTTRSRSFLPCHCWNQNHFSSSNPKVMSK